MTWGCHERFKKYIHKQINKSYAQQNASLLSTISPMWEIGELAPPAAAGATQGLCEKWKGQGEGFVGDSSPLGLLNGMDNGGTGIHCIVHYSKVINGPKSVIP